MRSEERYTVVVNHEDQYSIWSATRRIPLGWQPVGFEGTKAECFAYIKRVWRPGSPNQSISEQPQSEQSR